MLPLVFRDAELGTTARKARGDRGMAVVRAILITLPLLAIFSGRKATRPDRPVNRPAETGAGSSAAP